MIAIYLNKQQALYADSNATQQSNFTGNLDANATMFFILEEIKKLTIFGFSQKTVRVL